VSAAPASKKSGCIAFPPPRPGLSFASLSPSPAHTHTLPLCTAAHTARSRSAIESKQIVEPLEPQGNQYGHDQQGDHPAYDTPPLARRRQTSTIERGRIRSHLIDHIAGRDRHSFTVRPEPVWPTAYPAIERPSLSIFLHRAASS
jgi:hypothetical protein